MVASSCSEIKPALVFYVSMEDRLIRLFLKQVKETFCFDIIWRCSLKLQSLLLYGLWPVWTGKVEESVGDGTKAFYNLHSKD